MRPLFALIGLFVCLSSGERWNSYPVLHPNIDNKHTDIFWDQHGNAYNNKQKFIGGSLSPFFLPPHLRPRQHLYSRLKNPKVVAEPLSPGGHDNGNQIVGSKADINKETINILSNPVDKTYSAKEFLRNNGVQNNLQFHGRRSFGGDEPHPFVQSSLLSTVSGHAPMQAELISTHHGGKYWEKEKNHKTKLGYWIQPHAVHSPSIVTYPNNPGNTNVHPAPFLPDDFYPHPPLVNNKQIDRMQNNMYPLPSWNNGKTNLDLPDDMYYPHLSDNNNLNQLDENQNECNDHADIINEIRYLIRKWNIDEETYSLKLLFRILRTFIAQKNIENLPFRAAIIEIGRVLLNENQPGPLRSKVDQAVQEFKQKVLKGFFQEITSDQQNSLQEVVSKLAILIYNFKNSLIQRKFTQSEVKLVIHGVVQLSVPLVGYYFEQECKVKTQKYILQNLEVALNIKLEGIDHAESAQELEADIDPGFLGGGFENIGSLDNLNAKGPENLDVLGSLGGPGNPGGLGLGNSGLGNLGNLGLPGLGNLGLPGFGL